MVVTQKFDIEDIGLIKRNHRSQYKFLAICFVFLLLLSLLSATFLKNSYSYWITAIRFISVSIFIVFITWLQFYILYKWEIKNQIKYSGVVTITDKFANRKGNYIETDFPKLRKITIQKESLFNEVQIGDKLKIEISKYSKIIFKIDKI